MTYEITVGEGTAHQVDVARRGDVATVTIDGRDHAAALRFTGDRRELTLETATVALHAIVDADTVWVHAYGRAWQVSLVDPVERALAGGASDDVAVAPMPGTVITVAVQAGQVVTSGQPLVVIESMKMQSEIIAMRDGVVDRVFLAVGDTFERGAPLASLMAEAVADGDEENES